MPAQPLSRLRSAALLAAALLAAGAARGDAAMKDALPTFDNYIKIGAFGPSIDGNEAAFQRRVQQPSGGALGIEDMYLTKDLEKDRTLTIDGHALWGSEDYLAKFVLAKDELGSFEMGYKSFRTFYDGIGGFFPLNNQWNALNPEDLHVDRGEFWAGFKVARPDQPVFELRYVDGFRRGKKDTTVWGDSDFTGLPNNKPPISQVRKMVPSYRKLDEHHQTLNGSVTANVFGNTTARLLLTWETTDDDNTRYNARFPGEAKPFPTPPSTMLLPPSQMNNQVLFTQSNGMTTDLFAIRATTDTILNEKFTLRLGGNYEDLSSEFTGDRSTLTSTPTAVGVVQAPSNNYLNLKGGSDVAIYSGLIALEWKAEKNTFVKFALGAQDRETTSSGTLTSVTSSVNTTTGVITVTNSNQLFNSRVEETSYTPEVELRYTGFKDLALYASGSKRFSDGDERYQAPYNVGASPSNSSQSNDAIGMDRSRITVGANWRTNKWLELRGEIFAKSNESNYDGNIVRSDGYVDSYDLEYDYNGVKLTAVLKASPTLSFTTRYVYQTGQAKVQSTLVSGSTATYPVYDSMDMTNHMIGETINWTPNSQFYVQANLNYVANVINTVYPRAGTVPASGSNIAWDANGVLQNSNNNYFTGNVVGGAVLSKQDDLLFTYTYYRADNYDPQLANLTMPYGAGAEESLISIGLKHKFSDRCIGEAKLGYYDAKNDTTGGNTNFRGPVGYLSVTLAL